MPVFHYRSILQTSSFPSLFPVFFYSLFSSYILFTFYLYYRIYYKNPRFQTLAKRKPSRPAVLLRNETMWILQRYGVFNIDMNTFLSSGVVPESSDFSGLCVALWPGQHVCTQMRRSVSSLLAGAEGNHIGLTNVFVASQQSTAAPDQE